MDLATLLLVRSPPVSLFPTGFRVQRDPDLATAVKLAGAIAVAASAAGPEISRREGAFLVLRDDSRADQDKAALPTRLRRLPYTTALLLVVRAPSFWAVQRYCRKLTLMAAS